MATKAKTNKGAVKRFRANSAGTLIKRRRSGRSHILTKNSQDSKRRLRCQSGFVSASNVLRVVRMLKKKVVSVIKKK
ncbi:50S ribosomal protein L35 [Candidatus Synchoanobacter obligatus]|uniref:Large ribosomal subunit protein bL35 n=1 Tax=Candidatus Synchoanobacter obligatus TaxID=2919597 RepID=A0ABT1L397_9GAMM|nr:50S ribosomal protein L35 [Candidatus Synchoanobacter obligatus]MCP8351707.1 50S ribosomal protein L35 [Candidatus Synchoanobacter obligatus]